MINKLSIQYKSLILITHFQQIGYSKMGSLKWLVIDYDDEGQGKSNIPINLEDLLHSKSKLCIKVKQNATDLLYTNNQTVNLISIFGPAR